MKNIDIEKLNRKTPYAIPENTFDDIQKEVLENVKKKKGLLFSFPMKTAVAASLILMLGFVYYFFNTEKQTQPTYSTLAKTENKEAPQPKNIPEIELNDEIPAQHTVIPKEKNEIKKPAKSKTIALKKEVEETEKNIDFMIQSLSDEELSNLIAHYEKDIYLDIYNY